MPGILAFTAFVVLPLAALSISLGLKEFLDTRVASLQRTAAEIALASAEQRAASILAINTVPPGPVLSLPELALEVRVERDSIGDGTTLERLAETSRQERAVAALTPLLDRSLDHPAVSLPTPARAPRAAAGVTDETEAGPGDDIDTEPMAYAVIPAQPERPRAAAEIHDIAAELQVDTLETEPGSPTPAAWGPTALAAPDPMISPAAPPLVAAPPFDPELNPAIPERTVSRAPYRIQLGAYPTESEAIRERRAVAKRYGDLFDAQRLILQKRSVTARSYWRLIAGPFYDEAEANAICREIKARAGDCFVWVNRRG